MDIIAQRPTPQGTPDAGSRAVQTPPPPTPHWQTLEPCALDCALCLDQQLQWMPPNYMRRMLHDVESQRAAAVSEVQELRARLAEKERMLAHTERIIALQEQLAQANW